MLYKLYLNITVKEKGKETRKNRKTRKLLGWWMNGSQRGNSVKVSTK